jgi:hypothetical protein
MKADEIKRKLKNSDGQQFHQYLQNEQITLISYHFRKKTRRPGLGLVQT